MTVKMLLWTTPLVLQALIVMAMIVRRQVRTFPAFFAYIVFISLRDLILLLTKNNVNLYSWIYWLGEAISVFLGMAAICEVFWQLVKPYSFLRSIGKRILWISIVVLCGAGIALFAASYGKEVSRSIELVLLAERSARIVQVGALFVFITLLLEFGLTWRHHTVGIVVGFGALAGLQLGLYELKAHLNGISDSMFTLLSPLAYNCAVIIWTIYFLPPFRKKDPEVIPVLDLSKLDNMLADFIRK